jgi:hypothetical protein
MRRYCLRLHAALRLGVASLSHSRVDRYAQSSATICRAIS